MNRWPGRKGVGAGAGECADGQRLGSLGTPPLVVASSPASTYMLSTKHGAARWLTST